MAQLSFGIRSVFNTLRPSYLRGIAFQSVGSSSTKAASFSSAPALAVKEENVDIKNDDKSLSIYKRLSRFRGRPAGKVLDEWVKAGNMLKKIELDNIVKSLRKFGDYWHALEVSEWMDGSRGLRLGLDDFAIRLDLIAKIRGIASAETYFQDLPEKAKNPKTYGALLNSYVRNKMTEKAEGLMEVIKEKGFALKALPYNNMMTLYTKTGQPEKALSMVQEMKLDDIMPDTFTYKIWMNTYAELSDIGGVEKVLDELKIDGRFGNDWSIYSNLSAIYIKTGFVAKAEDALKVTEQRLQRNQDRYAYDSLIVMHTKLGNNAEVYRLWKKLRKYFPKLTNSNYICMLTSLVKLGDIEGAEKIFKDWESDVLSYDIRVPNILIGAYITEGIIKKAELLLEHAQEKGGKPNYRTWEMFVDGYLESKQTDKAIETMKKAISEVKYRDWQPAPEKALAILKLFEVSGDTDGAEDIFKRLRGIDHVSTDTYNSLVRTYVQAGKSPSRVLQRMKLDKIDPNDETDRLLKQIGEP